MSGEIEISGPDLDIDGVESAAIGTERPTVGHVGDRPVILLRTTNGIRAVEGKCSHYGAPLGDGLGDGERIHCPWHHAIFDLTTGEAVGAPALNPVPVYAVREEDGKVFVTGPVEAPQPDQAPVIAPESVVIVGAGAAGATAAGDPASAGLPRPGDPHWRRGAGGSPQCLQGLPGRDRPRGLDAVAQRGLLREAGHRADRGPVGGLDRPWPAHRRARRRPLPEVWGLVAGTGRRPREARPSWLGFAPCSLRQVIGRQSGDHRRTGHCPKRGGGRRRLHRPRGRCLTPNPRAGGERCRDGGDPAGPARR